MRELRWAPYPEYGIPDPTAESLEAPVGPVVNRAIAYRGDDIIVYWKKAVPRQDWLDLASVCQVGARRGGRADMGEPGRQVAAILNDMAARCEEIAKERAS